ncbi:hypothetical protein IMG5_169090 [Ichthyophthirius multifiliis]|uniref:Transmembrane protein n=1 Tax=Ichthyophthirius multifiliis TaxID=5932 RepID=G0R188_ICHMU|nr:hypothetical protein IMG5_169090 [Ichthyophthirius multifiliis]EGR28773.1 hypothetical protein IMG5_169090 [Ichthyophthirius multifiliis]|eukprot:XP_004030009.1 hypothetical protein IMG5_169090 [Ichthyophthirius multifiliis]
MVHLNIKSQVDPKESPFTHQWDSDVRANYGSYQKDIDRVTYQLQRSQRNIAFTGQWMYPKFFQKDILQLELLRKKQQLGKIYPNEVSSYKSINSCISSDLNNTFNAKWMWPVRGVAVGGGLFVVAQLFNLPYSFRLGMFIIPVVAEVAWTWGNRESLFRSLEFMDYLIQYRTSKALLEVNQRRFDNEQVSSYKKTINSNQSVQDLHNQLVKLVYSQQ